MAGAGRDRVTITGTEQVSATLRKAGVSLADMTRANQDAANIVAMLARSTAPRVSGALANATQAYASKEGAGIQNVLPYFGPIHYGWPARNIAAQPYVDEAVVATETQWLAVYEHAVQDACDQVKGA